MSKVRVLPTSNNRLKMTPNFAYAERFFLQSLMVIGIWYLVYSFIKPFLADDFIVRLIVFIFALSVFFNLKSEFILEVKE